MTPTPTHTHTHTLCVITAGKQKVWGKAMFLLVSVILSTGEGSLYDVTSCLTAWSHVPSIGVSVGFPPETPPTETLCTVKGA